MGKLTKATVLHYWGWCQAQKCRRKRSKRWDCEKPVQANRCYRLIVKCDMLVWCNSLNGHITRSNYSGEEHKDPNSWTHIRADPPPVTSFLTGTRDLAVAEAMAASDRQAHITHTPPKTPSLEDSQWPTLLKGTETSPWVTQISYKEVSNYPLVSDNLLPAMSWHTCLLKCSRKSHPLLTPCAQITTNQEHNKQSLSLHTKFIPTKAKTSYFQGIPDLVH